MIAKHTFIYPYAYVVFIMKNKRPISVKLSEEDIEFLELRGGKTKAIESLIQGYGKEREFDNIEERFWDKIISPGDPHLNETYVSLLESYISKGKRYGTIDYWLSILLGDTGLDQKTITKHLRKLNGGGYLTYTNFAFKPTLRLRDGVKREDFNDVFTEYESFLRNQKAYVDYFAIEKNVSEEEAEEPETGKIFEVKSLADEKNHSVRGTKSGFL